ncbi:MAG TPA: hypothetical protein VKD90_16870 [Gemmataceae bacterium]|nr:hypothetical protein [Gemmataceae bacterium]
MNPSVRIALVAIALGAPAAAQVRGPGEVTVPVGRLASVPVTVDADEADYLILGADCDGLREYDPDPKRLRLRVIGYSPGVAFLVVSAQKGGKLQPPTVVKVTFQGAGPTPPPVPPTPPDPRPPAKDGAWVVLIADQDRDSPAVAAVIASERFRQQLASWGLKFKAYDKSSPAVRDKGYLAHAKELPALLVLDKDGRVAGAGRCPETDAGAIEAVRKAVGR